MDVATTADLGALVRDRRTRRGLTQAEVAERAGVGRKLLSRLEQGHPSLEIGRVLAVLEALDLVLSVGEPSAADPAARSTSVLDAVFQALETQEPDHR